MAAKCTNFRLGKAFLRGNKLESNIITTNSKKQNEKTIADKVELQVNIEKGVLNNKFSQMLLLAAGINEA